jgi:hypothetical protein
LFASTGVSHPRALTEAMVNHWVAQGRANNTRRSRLARVCTFLRWCVRQGEADPALVGDWLLRYGLGVGRDLLADDPVVCRQKTGGGVGQVSWGHPFKQPASIRKLVAARAEQAALGHVSPHDLRRSAAGILHRSVSADGAHHFDLLDIQKVLGHANPATTMRSDIDPLDTGVIRRAAAVLD